MNTIQTYVQQGRHTLRKWAMNPKTQTGLRTGFHVLAGLLLSAGSLSNAPLPLAMGLMCACTGWAAVFVGLGGAAGYLLFWGSAGYPSLFWMLTGLVLTLLLADRKLLQSAPLLLPVTAGLLVAAAGVLFQVLTGEGVPLPVYLIQVSLAIAVTWLFTLVLRGRNPILDWLACGIGVLALAQVVPIPYLGLGYIAAGALSVAASFPATALAGLALDLSQVTSVPMTAVMALSYLVRFLPRYPKLICRLSPALVYIVVMYLCGKTDFYPLPGLLLGGFLGAYLPGPVKASHRRGETGVAQVRLEMAAGVLSQTQQLLLEVPKIPVDEGALVTRAAERACSNCAYRKTCKDTRRIGQLPDAILHKPLLHTDELPIICRKSGRFLAELHRSQEQLRSIQADRERQREYRAAVIQQYQFLSEFLQDLSDQLSRRSSSVQEFYSPQVWVYGNRPEADNGDRCIRFAGTGCKYYVLLCDGMGTGMGAVQEGKNAANLLRRLLTAGHPAQYALRSLNAICALRDRAGVVTVDLAEIELDNGKTVLYKWGAAPSYLICQTGTEKIGTATPPPGLSVTDYQETSHRLTLRTQQLLVLVSDGVSDEEACRCCCDSQGQTPGELAARMLSFSRLGGEDDATVVMIRLEEKN